MISRRPSRSRGVALLLTLAVLIVVTTSSAMLVRAVSTHQLRSRQTRGDQIARDLLRAAADPIEHWLSNHADEVALPPDAVEPRVAVLSDRCEAETHSLHLSIIAWDQSGMVPWSVARSGSPLRVLLPDQVLRVLDANPERRDHEVGLDELVERARPDRTRVYPTAGLDDESAIGAIVASHGDHTINVNTAPQALLERALRLSGRGGLESILAARSLGEMASVPPPHNGQDKQKRIRLATRSDAWAFRLDAEIRERVTPATYATTARQSWWCVYERKSPSQPWERVQRHVIAE